MYVGVHVREERGVLGQLALLLVCNLAYVSPRKVCGLCMYILRLTFMVEVFCKIGRMFLLDDHLRVQQAWCVLPIFFQRVFDYSNCMYLCVCMYYVYKMCVFLLWFTLGNTNKHFYSIGHFCFPSVSHLCRCCSSGVLKKVKSCHIFALWQEQNASLSDSCYIVAPWQEMCVCVDWVGDDLYVLLMSFL